MESKCFGKWQYISDEKKIKMEPEIESFNIENNDRNLPFQPFYTDNNLRTEISSYSVPNSLEVQSSFSRENNMFTFETEDPEDPDLLGEVELVEIEASLKDYSEGRFKSGSIDDLLKDLED